MSSCRTVNWCAANYTYHRIDLKRQHVMVAQLTSSSILSMKIDGSSFDWFYDKRKYWFCFISYPLRNLNVTFKRFITFQAQQDDYHLNLMFGQSTFFNGKKRSYLTFVTNHKAWVHELKNINQRFFSQKDYWIWTK